MPPSLAIRTARLEAAPTAAKSGTAAIIVTATSKVGTAEIKHLI